MGEEARGSVLTPWADGLRASRMATCRDRWVENPPVARCHGYLERASDSGEISLIPEFEMKTVYGQDRFVTSGRIL